MNKILAIDTSFGVTSISLFQDNKEISTFFSNENFTQAKNLIIWIEDILKQKNIYYNDISHIICTTGPGRFTSIRVGITCASAIAFAAKISSSGVSNLQILASSFIDSDKNILSIIESGREMFFIQKFDKTANKISSAKLITKNNLQEYLFKTNINIAIVKNNAIYASTKTCILDIKDNAKIAAKIAIHQIKNSENMQKLIPEYIRPPDAKIAKKLF